MNTDSYNKEELKEILDKRINTNAESKEHTFIFNGREYLIEPGVFSPAYFPNTQWYTQTILQIMPKVHSFLEVGTGAGNVLIEALLQGKCEVGVGSDISVPGVENAKKNGQKFNVKAEWIVSDVLDQIGKDKKFDLIYWNYPYHWSFDKDADKMTEIQRTVRDPGYTHLEKFLATAKDYLTSSGILITSYSLELANTKKYDEFCEKYGWKTKIIIERPADPSKKLPQLCMLQYNPFKTQ